MKKSRLKLGKETYGEKDLFQAFQGAFIPYFNKQEGKQSHQSICLDTLSTTLRHKKWDLNRKFKTS
jgi:hypothetical protein